MKKYLSELVFVKIFRQIFRTAFESAKYVARGYFKRGLYWFYVRNRISLLCDSNSGRKENPQLRDLSFSGFQKVNPISDTLNDRLIAFYLNRVGDGVNYFSLSEYFDAQRNLPFLRSSGVRIDNEEGLLRAIFDQTEINEIASQYLDLSMDEMCFSATIDSLTKISVERKLKNHYDDALEYHRDIDSLKFVKAFVYLNDIEVGCGHHEVFLNSHRDIPIEMRVIQRESQNTIFKKMPKCNLLQVVGKSGFAWVENTTTFHRGTIPTVGDRLILTFCFNDKKTGMVLRPDMTPLIS